jgi:hypothetical protein
MLAMLGWGERVEVHRLLQLAQSLTVRDPAAGEMQAVEKMLTEEGYRPAASI